MAKQVLWTKRALEFFIDYCCLNEMEEQIMRTRVKGWTRTQQAMALNCDLSTIDRNIKRLKIKYDVAQRENPDILPPRKPSAKETYMDNN